ncbi:hypothetical protein [Vibrio parahaemolyticus]|uniref:hypothetical protein n=2 Tax=Vibrio parahaemolyticus TaxID=670 RepID=UPI003297350A
MQKSTTQDQTFLSFLQSHPVLIFTLSALFCSGLGYWTEYSLLNKFGFNVVVYASIYDFLLAGLKYPHILGLLFVPIFLIMSLLLWKLSTIKKRNERNSLRLTRAELQLPSELEQLKSLKQLKLHDTSELDERIYDLELQISHLKAQREHEEESSNIAFSDSKNMSYFIILTMISMACVASFIITSSLSKKQYLEITTRPYETSKITLRTKDTLPSIKDCDFTAPLITPPMQPLKCNELVFITATEKYMFFHQLGTTENFVLPIASIAKIKTTQIRKREENPVRKVFGW